jgi:hypothetical protein
MTYLSIEWASLIKSDRLRLSAFPGNFAGPVRMSLANGVTFLVVLPLLNLELSPPLVAIGILGYRPTLSQGFASLKAYPTCERCAD